MKLWNGYLKTVPERLLSGAVSVLSLSDSKLDYQQRLKLREMNDRASEHSGEPGAGSLGVSQPMSWLQWRSCCVIGLQRNSHRGQTLATARVSHLLRS